jgi:uncharacterized SAM-binding protein YcdF (DUF218 family)
VAVVCLLAGTLVFAKPILRGIASLYIQDGPPMAADIIVVLAGDYSGERILKGAELAREGFAPLVLANSSDAIYGRTESELAIGYATQKGYSPDRFVSANWIAHSTVEEAKAAIAELRRRQVHRVLVVTSLWHTGRAGRIFRRLAPEMDIRMVGADDPEWHNGKWWIDRQGKKTFFLEGVKTIADYLGI